MIAGLITVSVLALFGYLLAAADAAFAHMLSMLVPSVDGLTLLRSLTAGAVTAVVITAATPPLLTRPPPPRRGGPPPRSGGALR